MNYNDYFDVECDGCLQPIGACTEEEWYEKYSKTLNLCRGCDIHCVSPDTLRRVGNLVLAAQVERQWAIEHGDITTAGWSDVDAAELDDVPF